MDNSISAGTRSDAKAIEFMRTRAMPKQVLPAKVEPPMKMPTTSVQQLRQRAEAEIASQQLYAPRINAEADLVQQREGELVARRHAAQRMDFKKFDAHVQNIKGILQAQYRAGQAQDVAQLRGGMEDPILSCGG